MGHQNDTPADSRPLDWYEDSTSPHEELELARLNAARAKAADEAAAAIARELNGPLTALLLYMGEIKHHSDQLSLGGFKRSSQHLEVGGCDERCKASIGAVRTSPIT